MEISKALSQLAEIHGHLAKTEVYRGCRSTPVALSGIFALLGGWLQPWLVRADSPVDFVLFWTVVAIVSFAFLTVEVGGNYWFRATVTGRRTTRKVVGQFIPCVVAGAAATVLLTRLDATHIEILPGLWALLFALGLFSVRPYMPRAIGWAALYYLVTGSVLLWLAALDLSLSPWGMAFTFGVGQLFAALVLYWNLERKEHA